MVKIGVIAQVVSSRQSEKLEIVVQLHVTPLHKNPTNVVRIREDPLNFRINMSKTLIIPLEEYKELLTYKAAYIINHLIYSTGKTILSKSRDEVIAELIEENKRLEKITDDLGEQIYDLEEEMLKLEEQLVSIPNWIKKLF